MKGISELPGIPEDGIALLREGGIETVEQFISIDAAEILKRLQESEPQSENDAGHPPYDLIEAWQITGREIIEKKEAAGVAKALKISPVVLKEEGIDIASLPVAKIFSEKPSILPNEKHRKKTRLETQIRDEKHAGNFSSALSEPPSEGGSGPSGGRSPEPQGVRRNRGMLHPRLILARLAAAATVITTIVGVVTLLGIVVVGIMILGFGSQISPYVFFALPAYPVGVVVCLLLGPVAKCPVCGESCFGSKNCSKHDSASRSILGFGFAAARDALLFSVFRCMYCGAKIRLRD